MQEPTIHHDVILLLMEKLIEDQKKDLLKTGRRLVPNLTPEDLLQPNDYDQLEDHPHFRYEEGILTGYQSVQMAIMALKKDLDLEENLNDNTHTLGDINDEASDDFFDLDALDDDTLKELMALMTPEKV